MSAELIDTITSELEDCSFTKDPDVENTDSNAKHYDGPSLIDIPIELFFKICSFLDLDFVSSTLGSVCKRFQNILEDENLWKYWLCKRIRGKKYPIFDDCIENIDWRDECVNVDRINSMWSNVDSKAYHFVSKSTHVASVDCLLVKNNGALCISGSRDRSMMVWDLKGLVDKSQNEKTGIIDNVKPLQEMFNAHGGWIWDLSTPSSNSNLVYSASWDNTVKVWDMTTFSCTHTFKCSISVLCLACIDENVAVVGLFSPKIAILDKRTGDKPVSFHKIHKRSVLDLVVKSPESYTIFTGSEDCTLNNFDMRIGNLVQKSILKSSEDHVYPLTLAGNDDLFQRVLFAGDTLGNLHLLDMNDLNNVVSNPLWSSSDKSHKITGLSVGAGALFTCSHNGNVDIMNPSNPPNRIANVKCASKELTALNYENDVLAVSGDSSNVEFWIPHSVVL